MPICRSIFWTITSNMHTNVPCILPNRCIAKYVLLHCMIVNEMSLNTLFRARRTHLRFTVQLIILQPHISGGHTTTLKYIAFAIGQRFIIRTKEVFCTRVSTAMRFFLHGGITYYHQWTYECRLATASNSKNKYILWTKRKGQHNSHSLSVNSLQLWFFVVTFHF